jgi:hypothetical protein
MKLAPHLHPSWNKIKTEHFRILVRQETNSESQAQGTALGDDRQRHLLAGETLGERGDWAHEAQKVGSLTAALLISIMADSQH